MVAEIALGGLEKEDKELHQLDRAVFSKVPFFSSLQQSHMSACLFHLPHLVCLFPAQPGILVPDT